MARSAIVLLSACLLIVGGLGIFAAELGLGSLGHSEQGYSCTTPPNSPACAALASQALLWMVVLVVSAIGLLAGLALAVLAAAGHVGPRGNRGRDLRPPN